MRSAKINICTNCGTDISDRGNRSTRCWQCQRDKNNHNRNIVRRTVLGFPRYCEQCGTDIRERNPLATICWGCRAKNQVRDVRKYYLAHKEQHAMSAHRYYIKNREIILAKMKKKCFEKRRYRLERDKQLFEVKLGNQIVTVHPGKKYGGVLGRKLIEQNPSRMISFR